MKDKKNKRPARSAVEFNCRAVFFGNNINTDLIHAPANFGIEPDKLRSNYISSKGSPDKGAAESGREITAAAGNKILIAGDNFGLGSSRFSTVMALRNEGVKCVAARSISRIFERNLASAGIFPLTISKNDNIHLSEYLFEDACGSAEIIIKPPAADKTVLSEIKLSVGGETISLRAGTDIFLFEIASAGGMVNYIASDKRY